MRLNRIGKSSTGGVIIENNLEDFKSNPDFVLKTTCNGNVIPGDDYREVNPFDLVIEWEYSIWRRKSKVYDFNCKQHYRIYETEKVAKDEDVYRIIQETFNQFKKQFEERNQTIRTLIEIPQLEIVQIQNIIIQINKKLLLLQK